ncbi:hypothetical protein OUZ56_003885 [Daphnia magna]|uniref:Uncharacterized protein n=1 Tax=Daphnia magna TaxID=35525 RepID=A0ABQ9YN37_9CRUS|nr:hypothetical protein OUZ56_003885 [Daphnia magna]
MSDSFVKGQRTIECNSRSHDTKDLAAGQVVTAVYYNKYRKKSLIYKPPAGTAGYTTSAQGYYTSYKPPPNDHLINER